MGAAVQLPLSMKMLLAAIVDDDPTRVSELLAGNAILARRFVDNDVLYESGIFHWICVGDAALHLAAAGYRVTSVQLLITAGADPNAIRSRRRNSPYHESHPLKTTSQE